MEAQARPTWPMPPDNTLLIVDDDRAFLARLARAMETRGFEVGDRSLASRRACRRSAAGRRLSPWWICGSTTAAASMSSPR